MHLVWAIPFALLLGQVWSPEAPSPERRVFWAIASFGRFPFRRQVQPLKGNLVKSSVTNFVMALGLVAIGIAIGAAGIYLGDTDDAPGAALIGILLMIGMVALGVRTARRKT